MYYISKNTGADPRFLSQCHSVMFSSCEVLSILPGPTSGRNHAFGKSPSPEPKLAMHTVGRCRLTLSNPC